MQLATKYLYALIICHVVQKSGGVAETGELIDAENVDEFTIADISYFSEYGV